MTTAIIKNKRSTTLLQTRVGRRKIKIASRIVGRITPSSVEDPENVLEMTRGTSKTIMLTITDEDGEAFDITGGRLVLSVKQEVSDGVHALIVKTTDDLEEAVIADPRAGEVEIYIKPGDTQNLIPDAEYFFDVWLVLPSEERFNVVPPTSFKVKDSVTRIPV